MSSPAVEAVPVDRAWTLRVDDAPVSASTGGGLIAVGGAGGGVWTLDPATGTATQVLHLPDGLLRVAVNPSGDALAATGPGGYALWRAGDRKASHAGTGAWSATAVWGARGQVAVAAGRRALVLGADGALAWECEPAASTVTDLAWLRDGRRLAVAAYGSVRCHERHQRMPVATYDYTGSHLALAASAGGRWLCSGNQDASIHIWRLRDASELTMAGYPEKIARIGFDDTGRWLAADGSADITVWDFAGQGPAGTAPRHLVAHDGVSALAWRPGARAQLASGGTEGTVVLWEAASGSPGGQINPARRFAMDAAVTALAWAGPDLLIAADRSGRVEAFRLPGVLER